MAYRPVTLLVLACAMTMCMTSWARTNNRCFSGSSCQNLGLVLISLPFVQAVGIVPVVSKRNGERMTKPLSQTVPVPFPLVLPLFVRKFLRTSVTVRQSASSFFV